MLRRGVFILAILASAWPVAAQSGNSATLTLDQAVQQALVGNRPVKAASMMPDRVDKQIEALRTQRLPNFDLRSFGGSLLAPIYFDFPAGSFGNYEATGPIPFTDTSIKSPALPALGVLFTVAQPLTQLHKISLGTKVLETSRDLAREDLRQKQADLVTSVKKVYYGLLETRALLATLAEAESLVTELQREVKEYVSRQVALPGDEMTVEVRLAETALEKVKTESALLGLRDQLNLLLGRDLSEPLEVVMPPQPEADVDLTTAQRRALEHRPEVHDAVLKAKQAGYAVQVKQADFLPDVSVMVSYLGMYNVAVLPRDTLGAGIYLTWEPFDWGRRRLEREASQKTADAATIGIAEAREQVLADVNASVRALTEARAALRVAELTATAADENLRVARSRYSQQASLLRDVLEAQLAVASARQKQQHAQLATWIARAELERAMGDAAP